MSIFRRSADEGDRWVVAGLGNPESRYAQTRHNAGAMTLDVLLERAGASPKAHKSGCLIAETKIAGVRVTLARPTSYMNESGRPLGALVRFYKIPVEQVIVLQDEIDLPFGTIRIKEGGGLAGHNGLRSIASHLGSNEFLRVRIGVGRPSGRREAAGHVLDTFTSQEQKELPFLLEEAADAAELIIEAGVERAMNEVNTRTPA